MTTVTFTQFRQHAKTYIDAAEKGETIRISRHGKAIVRLTQEGSAKMPSWKKPALRLKIKGVSLSDAIIEERKDRF